MCLIRTEHQVILAFVANVLGKHFGETLCLLANHLGLASSTALVMGTTHGHPASAAKSLVWEDERG